MFSIRRPFRLAVVIFVAALSTVACGDDGDSPSDGGSASTSTVQNSPSSGSGSPSSAADGGAATAQPAYRPPSGSEQERAAGEVDDLYRALGSGGMPEGAPTKGRKAQRRIDRMVRGVCDMLSKAALEQIQDTSPSLDDHPITACRESLGVYLGRAARNGALQRSTTAVITDMKVDGDKATAKVRFRDSPPRSVSLVKEGGEWKFDAVPTS